jgi:CO/xanthine dehydrogenase Mo-binding subunit
MHRMTTFDPRSKHGDAADGSPSMILGTRVSRRDGPAKITGVAHYAVEHRPENLAHAVTVQSTIAAGRVRRIDIAVAQAYPRPPALLTATARSSPVTKPVGLEGRWQLIQSRQHQVRREVQFVHQRVRSVDPDHLKPIGLGTHDIEGV